jgi:lipopolysaccharide/colanic/teichoic acid biosynthesis glycosyltransferase
MPGRAAGWPVAYALAKRLFDIGFSLVILLPLLVLVAGACWF